MSRSAQDEIDSGRDARPMLRFNRELFPTEAGQSVESSRRMPVLVSA
jgi:hypothetical protein